MAAVTSVPHLAVARLFLGLRLFGCGGGGKAIFFLAAAAR
jgi:hypothetical protein